jgi:glycosyltransferase involved in cell wall biosynthesis
MPLRCLLIGPNEEGEHASGEDSYVRSLLMDPPPEVEYVHYSELLADGRGKRQPRVHRLFSRLAACGYLRPAPWVETISSDEDFDLVHVHGFDVRLGGKISRRPVILGTSSYGPANCETYWGWEERSVRRYHRRLGRLFRLLGIYDACNNLRNAKQVIVWSRYARVLHVEARTDAARVAVIPPGVEVPALSSSRSVEKAGALFVGRDFQRKGGDVLLEAWKRLPAGKARLTMIGFNGVSLPPEIEHYPYVSPLALKSYFYMKSQILAFPTRAEGYGLAVLEAMAHGLAVVASRVGAMSEIVVDGETGFLAAAGDVEALAGRLGELFDNPRLCREMGERGRQRVITHFSLERRNDLLRGLYESVLE